MNEISPIVAATPYAEVIAQYGKQDTHLNDSGIDRIPYVIPQAFWKPLRFDVTRVSFTPCFG